MFSINRIFFTGAVISAAAAVLVASGCGVAGAGMQRAAEVRVATTLEAGSPKVIVSGPARLLHVDVRRPPALNVYSVKRGADGKVRLHGQGAFGARLAPPGASNELNLDVRADEAVCLANDAGDASRAKPTSPGTRAAAPTCPPRSPTAPAPTCNGWRRMRNA